ncbi:hypothetical protein DYL61_17650 [Pseudomonas nabeulensis]|uniref:Nucleotide-diphospho-sugar transferase domain-containing protein n=1 Tax=Pseudomonas nabeulensis TaxID=2293833 RepID=A0A4Z0B240_9PSED|nr:glycosyltransferase [Pseudomonas nabeulensis]TFY92298.1 hypothetical protein DYL61_17650 [Pseudomonas nabeulensis]
MTDVQGTTVEQSTIFTVCNLAYLSKALVLAESLIKFGQQKLKIYIFDRKIEIDLPNELADFYWVEEIGLENVLQYAFKYDIVEFSTSLKPWISLNLLAQYNKVVFLDPDTCVFNSLEGLWNELDTHDIILTPHYVKPHIDGDIGMLRFGSFNLGFYAVSNTSEAHRFLQWWNERCLDHCYFETQFGLSTDQKWVSIAPCFFPTLHVSFNLGYNVAFWNSHERVLSSDGRDGYTVNGEFPLIFFHFSSFDEKNPELLSKRAFAGREEKRQDLLEVSRYYKERLSYFSFIPSNTPYAFDYMNDGKYISPTLRRAYASVMGSIPNGHDPFATDGPVYKFAKKNYLFETGGRYKPAGFEDAQSHSGKLKAINSLLKIILFTVGPNRFMNISRLFVYLSSFRLNKKLWKL